MPVQNRPIIYHNPRCSKSREALSILRDRGFDPLTIEYLKSPPTMSELQHIIELLGVTARDILRKNEPEYKQFGLDNLSLSDLNIMQIIIEHPILMERPIVVCQNKAVIARPPELLLNIL